MSIFNGKLRRLGKLGGSLTDKKPQLRVKITPLNDAPKVTLSSCGGFSATWERAGRVFAGAARPLHILYRFVAASVAVLTGRKSKAGTAPAQEIEADSAAVAGVGAPLTAQPAQEVTAHAKPHAAVWAQLEAYNRAAAVTLSRIIAATLAKAEAAPGVLAKYRKRMALERISKAEAAGSAIIESRFGKVYAGVDASAGSAPGEELTAARGAALEVTAPVGAAAGAVNHAARGAALAHFASISFYWIYPVLKNGVLTIRQAYEPLQDGAVLEIDHLAWTFPALADGVLLIEQAHSATQTTDILEVV